MRSKTARGPSVYRLPAGSSEASASDLQKTLVTHSRDGRGFISQCIPSNTKPDGGQKVPINTAKRKITTGI